MTTEITYLLLDLHQILSVDAATRITHLTEVDTQVGVGYLILVEVAHVRDSPIHSEFLLQLRVQGMR